MKKPCKKDECPICGKEVDCNWWHQVKEHNMPIGFWGVEKASGELHYHLGYFWEQIKELINNPKKSVLLGTEQRDIKCLAKEEK